MEKKTGSIGFQKTTAVRIAVVVLAAIVLAFGMELLQLCSQPTAYSYAFDGDSVPLYDASNAKLIGYEWEDGWLVPQTGDPQLVLDTSEKGTLSSVQISLREPLLSSGEAQIFYVKKAWDFTEEQSVKLLVSAGDDSISFSIPSGEYAQIRLDIDLRAAVEDVRGSAAPFLLSPVSEPIHFGRVLFVAVILFVLLGIATAARVGTRFKKACCRVFRAVRTDPKQVLIGLALFAASAIVAAAALWFLLPIFGVTVDRAVKVFILATGAVVGVLVAFRRAMGDKPEYIFLVLALSAGTLMAVYMPSNLGNSWDEITHYKNALRVSYVDEVRYTPEDYRQIRSEEPRETEIDAVWAQREAQDAYYAQTPVFVIKTDFKIQNIWALPSAFGLYLARVLGVPYYMTLIFGRMGNLLCYVFVGFLAIRRLKSGKMILSAVLLAPTNLFMASAFSYDPWVTVFAALGLSYFFREWQEPDRPLRWQDAMVMVFSLAIACPPKAIYFPLLFLLFFLPKSKFTDKRMRRGFFLLILLAMLLLLLSFALPFLTNMNSRSDMRGGSTVSAPKQLKFILFHPFHYAKLLFHFLAQYLNPCAADGYLVNFAYHGMAPHATLYVALLAVAAFTDKNHFDTGLQKKWRLRFIAYGVLLITAVLIATSLYVSFTPVEYKTILGCQPRYLFPLVFPALYLLGSSKVENRMDRRLYNGAIFAVAGFVLFSAVVFNCMSELIY